MSIAHFDELPAEIRLYIFRLATIKVSQHEDTHVDYRPFEAVAMHDRDWSSSTQQALDVKRTIVLVSKEWKNIATEMLYECIRVGHGTQELITALEGPLSQPHPDGEAPEKTFDNGRWVRRIEISPFIQDFDPFRPLPLLKILQSCPEVEVVVRPCTALMGGLGLGTIFRHPSAENVLPTFPSVKRIDWWLPSSMPGNRWTEHESGLQGFLGDLVGHTPNLQYLTLSGFIDWMMPYQREPFFNVPAKAHPSITTFRLEGEDWRVPSIDLDLSFPNLTRLVLGITKTPAGWILERNGHLVQVLEFVNVGFPPHARGSDRAKTWCMRNVFAACPNIRELSVSLDMGSILAEENEKGVVLNALRCIRVKLDSGRCTPLQSEQFGVFVKEKLVCPALERIVLYGKEEEWKENHCFKVLKDYVTKLRYATLEFASI